MSDHIDEVPVQSSSLMEGIREQHRKLAESQSVTMAIPGYEGFLAVEYRVLDVQKEINTINRRTSLEFKDGVVAALFSTIDAMSKACVQIFGVRGEENVPLAESFGPDHPPVRYDQALAEFMGFKGVEAARDVILEMFAHNEPMILDHGIILNRWMTNTSRGVNEAFAGNL